MANAKLIKIRVSPEDIMTILSNKKLTIQNPIPEDGELVNIVYADNSMYLVVRSSSADPIVNTIPSINNIKSYMPIITIDKDTDNET